MIPLRKYARLLRSYLRPQRPRVVLMSALLLAGIALQLINPQIIRWFIDTALAGGSQSVLLQAAILFAIFAVGHQALAVVATWVAVNVAWTATNRMRGELAAHCLDLDMGFHKEHTPGELIERIDGDVTTLSNFFSQFSIHVAGNLVLTAGVLVLLFFENVLVGAAVTVFAVVTLGAMIGIQQAFIPVWRRMRGRSAEFLGFLGEQLGGTEDIRGNGAEPFSLHRFTAIMRRWLPDAIGARYGWSTMWAGTITLFAFGTSLVYWLGDRLFFRGELTLGSVYLVFFYVEMLRQPLEQIREQMQDLQKAGAGIARVEELFATESKLPAGGDLVLPGEALGVEFDAVTFSYGDDAGDDIVLDDVSFRLEPGRVLGLLGRTGSGKTTIARLLTRLYDPLRGEVRVGGVPLDKAEPASLRSRVGMVTQDVQLFRATVRDNLTFFDQTVPDERIHDVLLSLGLADWLFGLPDGLDTVLRGGGGELSAGQGQLLAFARIFLKDPGLVILDEASSRLDPATEQLVERAVDRLLADRTGVLIAHRLATVTRADDILIMERGRIVEAGERVALAADPGSRFSALLATGIEEVLT